MEQKTAESLIWLGVIISVLLICLALLCWLGIRRQRMWDEFNAEAAKRRPAVPPMAAPPPPARPQHMHIVHTHFPSEDLLEAVYLLKEAQPVLNACMVAYDRDGDLQVRVRKFLNKMESRHGE